MTGLPNRPPPDDYQVEVPCPNCGAHVGAPIRVSTRKLDPGTVDVTMQCKDCGVTWVMQKLIHDTPPS